MNRKQKIATAAIAIVIVGGGTTYGVVQHNNSVHAAQLQTIKTEKSNLTKAKAAVALAYKSRNSKDIASANTTISKLDKSQKKDKSELSNKMTELKGFLAQISAVNTALTKAIKTKADADINATQALINKETNSYLKNDKATAQNKLNALKTEIAKAKAAKPAPSGQASTQSGTSSTSGQSAASAPSQADSGQAAQGASGYTAPAQQGQAPAQGGGGYQAPAQQAPSQQAPAAPSQQAPSQGGATVDNTHGNGYAKPGDVQPIAGGMNF